MSNQQESVLFGLFIIIVMTWIAVLFWKWVFRRIEQFKESRVADKVKASAHAAIAKSSEGISTAAKAGATLAKRVTKEDPNARYDALMKIKQLLDAGALTPEEYEIEKQKLLNP